MALSNKQIERYSRQIIVPGIGGVGQERLLASRMVIAGEFTDIEMPLAYMVGAGVGRISLAITGTSPNQAGLIGPMRKLNPDVAIATFIEPPLDTTLVLAIVGSAAALEHLPAICTRDRAGAVVFARLDTPSKIAIIPSRPPCPVCAEAHLLAGFSRRSQEAGAIAMIAAAEALKLLAGQGTSPRLIAFDGYEAKTRELVAAADCPQCGARIDETTVRR